MNLRNQIQNLLSNDTIDIHENEILNALLLAKSIFDNNLTIALVASMQSGKSKTAYTLFNYILPSLDLIKEEESVIFLTSMSDVNLYKQNVDKIERDYYCFINREYKRSYLKVVKMHKFLALGGTIINNYNVKYIVRDEDQYGCGQESSFDKAFFLNIKTNFPNIPLIAISATPYDILDAKVKGEEVDVIVGDRPANYFGITEMLKEGVIRNLPSDYRPLQYDPVNKDNVNISPIIRNCIEYLKNSENGFGVIRVSKTAVATELRKEIKNEYKSLYDVAVIGCREECDLSIKEGFSEIYQKIHINNKKMILIIINALSAGKDLNRLKKYFRFGIESRKSQLANGSQGVPGRICGYHKNRDFIIYANQGLLEHYSEFELDPEIYENNTWRNILYSNDKVKALTTQTNFNLEQKAGLVRPVTEISTYSVDQLFKPKIVSDLDFMDSKSIDKLISFFKGNYYESIKRGVKLNCENTTIRIASNYNEGKKIYSRWKYKVGSNFNGIFFKKKLTHRYGILVSNFPSDHHLNEIGFCGIKVFKTEGDQYLTQLTNTVNKSMYVERENVDF